MKRILFLTLLFGLLALAACQDKVAIAPAKTGSVTDFPNTIGLYWKYEMVDNRDETDSSKNPDKDTLETFISGINNSAALGEATIWSQQLNNVPIKEKLVKFSGDTVYFIWNYDCISDSACYFDKIGIVFPFEYGDNWTTGTIFNGDRTKVIDTTSMTTPIGIFNNVFVLENTRRGGQFTDWSRTITLWFVPKFGILRIHLHEEHPQAIGDTTWVLYEHNNSEF